jgi:hypothetical protein
VRDGSRHVVTSSTVIGRHTPLQRAIAADADRHHLSDGDEVALASCRPRLATRKQNRQAIIDACEPHEAEQVNAWRGDAGIERASDQTILQDKSTMQDTRPLMKTDGTASTCYA